MEFTVKTPMVLDKVISAIRAASSIVKRGLQIALGFCKTHAPLIFLIGGVALAVAGFICSFIFRKKQGAECEAADVEQDKELKKKHLVQNIVSVGLFTVGTALEIVSYIISAGRINALARALAGALTGGSILAAASLNPGEERTVEEEQRLEVARDNFSFHVEDIPSYRSYDGYYSYEVFTHLMNQLKRRLSLGMRVSWNDVMIQLAMSKKDWGYDIGWSDEDEFKWIMVDPWGRECSDTEELWASVSGNFANYRIYMLGMHNLSYFDHNKGKHVRPIVEGEERDA